MGQSEGGCTTIDSQMQLPIGDLGKKDVTYTWMYKFDSPTNLHFSKLRAIPFKMYG